MNDYSGPTKPTEIAEEYFKAVSAAMTGAYASDPKMRDKLIFYGLQKTAEGLEQLSIGVRATYLEIQELKRMIRMQSMGRAP